MKKFQDLGTVLSREQSKKIKGGCFGCEEIGGGEAGCGHGISCAGKQEGDECGTRSCACEKVPDGGNVLYCIKQL